MQKALILIREPGHAVPAEVLKPLFAKYNRAIGFAMADGTSVRVTRGAKSKNWTPSPESFVKGDKQFSDRKVVYCFMEITDDQFNNADLQPYVVATGDQNSPLIVAFMDGNFAANEGGVNRHTQALVFEKHIGPILNKAFKGVDKNLDQFVVDELTDPNLGQRMLQHMIGDDGSIVVMTANDEAMAFFAAEDKTQKTFPWGWLSNTKFMASETVVETPKEEVSDDPFQQAAEPAPAAEPATPAVAAPAAQGGFRRRGTAAASVPKIASVDSISSGKPAGSDASSTKIKMVEVKIPKGCEGSKSMGNFLRSRYPESLPEDWLKELANGFTIPFSQANPKLLADIEAKPPKPYIRVFEANSMEELAHKFNGKGTPAKSEQPEAATVVAPAAASGGGFRRRTATAAAPTVEKDIPSQTAPENKDVSTHELGNKRPGIVPKVWLIPPAEKADMIAFMNDPAHEKALDRNSQRIPDPTTFVEADRATFAKQLGDKRVPDIWSTVNWDEDLELPMIKNAPNTAMAYLRDWKTQAIKYRHQVLELTGRKLEAEEKKEVEQQPEQKKAATGSGGFRSLRR